MTAKSIFEMKEILIDTDTISFFLKGNEAVIEKFKTHLEQFGYLNISVISYYEVLNGLMYKDAKKKMTQFNEFAKLNNIIPMSESIAQKAAKIFANLRTRGITIGHTDVLIAATAIDNNLVLATNNTKHFQHIEELELVNWVELNVNSKN